MPNTELLLRWPAREDMRDRDAEKFAAFVNGLPQFDPIYLSWLSKPKAGSDVFSVPLTEEQARRYLAGTRSKYDTGGEWPEGGSSIWAGHAGDYPHDFRRASYAATEGTIGAAATKATITPNRIVMRLSEIRPATGRPWRAEEFRPLMKFAHKIWAPTEMCALPTFQISGLPKIADPTWAVGKRPLKPWIGWITYLPPDLAARAHYPSDVEVETLADGAALVTLCEEPFDKSDAAGLARLRALEAALRPIQS